VALYPDDTFVVVWHDYRSTTQYDIYAQKLNSTGNVSWGSTDKLVNQNSDSADQGRPTVAVDSNGYAIVVWYDERNGDTDDDIYAQMLDLGGNAQWGSTDKKVNQNSDSEMQLYPEVAVDSNDDAIVVWHDTRGSGTKIYAQKIDSDGITQWGSSDLKINQSSGSSTRWYPAVVVDSSDNVIVVWQDGREPLEDIYAQKFNATNVTGRAYIFYGSGSISGAPDLNLTGENDGDKFGFSVHAAGDIDGDGKPDVIVGAPYWDNGAITDCGQILIFRGGSSMDTIADYVHNGTQANEHFGWSVSLALIMDGGSNSMVVVGSPHHDGSTDTGEAEVLYIPEYTTLIMPIVSTIVLMMIGRKRIIFKKRKRTKKVSRQTVKNYRREMYKDEERKRYL
jgi:hypothetical protein